MEFNQSKFELRKIRVYLSGQLIGNVATNSPKSLKTLVEEFGINSSDTEKCLFYQEDTEGCEWELDIKYPVGKLYIAGSVRIDIVARDNCGSLVSLVY